MDSETFIRLLAAHKVIADERNQVADTHGKDAEVLHTLATAEAKLVMEQAAAARRLNDAASRIEALQARHLLELMEARQKHTLADEGYKATLTVKADEMLALRASPKTDAAIKNRDRLVALDVAYQKSQEQINAALALGPVAVKAGRVLAHKNPDLIADALKAGADLVYPTAWDPSSMAEAELVIEAGVVKVAPDAVAKRAKDALLARRAQLLEIVNAKDELAIIEAKLKA